MARVEAIINGKYWCESTLLITNYFPLPATPLLIRYQYIEALVQGDACYASPRQDETSTPLISSLRYILCHDTKNSKSNDEDHKSRNKKSERDAGYLPGKALNESTIKNVTNDNPSTMSDEELIFYKLSSNKEGHFKKE